MSRPVPKKIVPVQTLLRRIVAATLVVGLLSLIGLLLIPLLVGKKEPTKTVNKEPLDAQVEQDPEFVKTRLRLFPQEGYKHYASVKDVPWEKVLISRIDWTEEEDRVIGVAATLILPAMGKDDPSYKTLPTKDNGGKNCVVKAILPMDEPISILSNGRVEFIDSIWVPETQSIHLSRRMVRTSLILTASQLYENCRRALATPDLQTAELKDPKAVSAEVFADVDRFHEGLHAFLLKNQTENQKRQLLELRVVMHNVSTHQKTGEGFMKVGMK